MLRFCLYFLCGGLSTTSIHKRPCYEHQGISEGTTGRQESAGRLPAGQGGSVLPINSPGNDGNQLSPSPDLEQMQNRTVMRTNQFIRCQCPPGRQKHGTTQAYALSMEAGMLAWIWSVFSGFMLQ